MKKTTLTLLVSAVALACSVQAQPGRMSGPQFNAAIAKLFGQNTSFSAAVEIQMAGANGQVTTMPGKFAFDSGNSRFEMNMGDIKGTQMQPAIMERMKAMGMDTTVMITRLDKKTTYMVYPGLSAYAEMPMQDSDAGKLDSLKVDSTELGKETFDGHPCVKKKIVLTDDQGKTHESTVWAATDLKDFPIKIETAEGGHNITMLYKDIKTSKPDAALFEAPADFKKYESAAALMQGEIMKRVGGGMGMPPAHQ